MERVIGIEPTTFSIAPGANALDVISSNGIDLLIGNQ